MKEKEFLKNVSNEENEFADDIVFARFINYMDKALLHKRIDYLRHQEYLNKKEENVRKEELSRLSNDDKTDFFFNLCFDNKSKYKLNQAIEKLTEKQRVVVISHYYKKKTLKTIATEMNCTVGAVKMVEQRAKQRLKKLLEDRNEK